MALRLSHGRRLHIVRRRIMRRVPHKLLHILTTPIVFRPGRRVRRVDHFVSGVLLLAMGVVLLVLAAFVTVTIDGWPIVWGMAVLGVVCAIVGIRSLRTARSLHYVPPPGCCRACGYDLRATPLRCPECGAVPEDVAVACGDL